MSRPSTRKLSDAHEAYVAQMLGMRVTRGSGNQFVDQMDGKHEDGPWSFAFDGKATLGKSIGVTRAMWEKAVEQAHGKRPLLPLRFYADERLKDFEALDLVVCDLYDLSEMIAVIRNG